MKNISILFSIQELQTMIGLLDGCLGTSDSDDFNKEVKPILKRMQKAETLNLSNKKSDGKTALKKS